MLREFGLDIDKSNPVNALEIERKMICGHFPVATQRKNHTSCQG
jgi:hypothetical protein